MRASIKPEEAVVELWVYVPVKPDQLPSKVAPPVLVHLPAPVTVFDCTLPPLLMT